MEENKLQYFLDEDDDFTPTEDELEDKTNLDPDEPAEEVQTTEDEEEVSSLPEEDKEYYSALYEFLREKEVVKVGDDFEFEPSETGFNSVLEATKAKLQEEVYESLFEELPEQGKQLLEYYRNGGRDLQEFAAVYSEPDYNEVELGDEEVAKAVIFNHLSKTTTFSEDKINREIQRLEQRNELMDVAEEARQELISIQHQEREALKAKAAADAEARREAARQAEMEVANILKKNQIKGISITSKEAEALRSSIFRPVRKGNQVTTTFMDRLQKALTNPEETLLLAKLCNADFDLGFMVPQAKVQAGKEISKNLKELQKKRVTKQPVKSGNSSLDLKGRITLG